MFSLLISFETYTSGGKTFTATEQADAWEAYIEQDGYLQSHRGQYAERNAVFLPMVRRGDFSFAQDLSTAIKGKANTLEFRVDILNVGNLINSDWGAGQRHLFLNTNNFSSQPLVARPADSQGRAVLRLQNINGVLPTKSLEPTNGFSDVYRIQFGFRYLFN